MVKKNTKNIARHALFHIKNLHGNLGTLPYRTVILQPRKQKSTYKGKMVPVLVPHA